MGGRRGCVWNRCVPRLLRCWAAGRQWISCSTATVGAQACDTTTALTPRGEGSWGSDERQSAADQRLIEVGILESWTDPIACQENLWSHSLCNDCLPGESRS